MSPCGLLRAAAAAHVDAARQLARVDEAVQVAAQQALGVGEQGGQVLGRDVHDRTGTMSAVI